MRIAILGASGRVGTRLIELILANPGLELVAALVSPHSRLVGTSVAGGSIEYRPAERWIKTRSDVMIDFSTPAASLAMQELLGAENIPVVIGTTGFNPEDDARLTAFASSRPLMISANFARGFEAFRRSAIDFARRLPDADVTISETYHARKKADPSGTSRLLARDLFEAQSLAMGFPAPEPVILVDRIGETVGINEVRFTMGSARTVFSYRVETLAAYAEGALAAAQWLVSQPRAPSRYSLANSLVD